MQGTRELRQGTPELSGANKSMRPPSSAGNGWHSRRTSARSSKTPVLTGSGKEAAAMAAERRGIVYISDTWSQSVKEAVGETDKNQKHQNRKGAVRMAQQFDSPKCRKVQTFRDKLVNFDSRAKQIYRWNAVCGESRTHGAKRGKIRSDCPDPDQDKSGGLPIAVWALAWNDES